MRNRWRVAGKNAIEGNDIPHRQIYAMRTDCGHTSVAMRFNTLTRIEASQFVQKNLLESPLRTHSAHAAVLIAGSLAKQAPSRLGQRDLNTVFGG
jgi:hypothetical protein